ncbi:MAG: CDP-alcohol phosphatidyltransferase family protein [Candidatus Bipolaricaulia bacterium]
MAKKETKSKAINIANTITVSRLALLPPLLIYLFRGDEGRLISFGLLLAMLAGDLLDGAIARWLHQVTPEGKFLDPAVDKLVFAAVLISLAVLDEIAWLAMILLLTQQIGMLVGFLVFYRGKELISARHLGKFTSAILALAVVLTYLSPYADRSLYQNEILYVGVVFAWLAGFDYLMVVIRRSRRSQEA